MIKDRNRFHLFAHLRLYRQGGSIESEPILHVTKIMPRRLFPYQTLYREKKAADGKFRLGTAGHRGKGVHSSDCREDWRD